MSGASPAAASSSSSDTPPAPPAALIRSLPLSQIRDGPATRQRLELDDEHVRHLARSIAQHGLLNPLRVAAHDDHFILVAGGHRREALNHLGYKVADCIIDRDAPAKRDARAALDNLDRRDLSPLEEAEAVRQMHCDAEVGTKEIASQIGRSHAWVLDRLDLLRWPPEILEAIHHGTISKSAAAPLAQIAREDLRAALLLQAIKLGSSARTTSQWLATARARTDSGVAPDAEAVLNAPDAPRVIPTADCAICGQRDDLANLSTPAMHATCLEDAIAFISHHAPSPAPPDPAIEP